MEGKKQKSELRLVSSRSTPERGSKRRQILDLIAGICHKSWMKQRSRDKGLQIGSMPQNVSDDDRERAEDAWQELENVYKKLTRQEAIGLVGMSSHKMWLKHKERDRLKSGGSVEILDLKPNEHDLERAEDIIKALEASGIVSFRE